MYAYTENNFISWQIDGAEWALPGPKIRTWDLTFRSRAKKFGNFREECVRAAENIRRSTHEEIFVLLSGGIDGEFICRAFLEAGYRVTPLIYRWPHQLNEEDLGYAYSFCDRFGLTPETREVDVVEFFRSGYRDYCDRLNLPFWQAVWKSWLYDQHDGFLICGHGWPTTDSNQDQVIFREDTHSINPLIESGRPGIPDFFRYSPEILLSVILDPMIFRWCHDCRQPFETIGKHTAFKFFALARFWAGETHPPVFREKRTGTEKINDLCVAAIADSKAKYSHNVKTKSWTYSEFRGALYNGENDLCP